jgi:RecB family exonuclease
MTLWQAATALAGPGVQWTVATGLTGRAVLTRAVDRLRSEERLGRFGPVADTPGFAVSAATTVAELRMAGLERREIATQCEATADLAEAYDEALVEAGLTDVASILARATKALKDDAFEDVLTDVPVLLMDVRLLSKLEADFCEALLGRSTSWLATAAEGDGRTETALAGIAQSQESEIESPQGIPTPFEQIQGALFGEGGEKDKEDADLAVFAEAGEHLECVEIARRILRKSREGVRFDEMAVLLHAPHVYRPHLEEAFDRAEVPVYFAQGVSRPDPSGRALMSLLYCAAERLSARRFAEYLSLGQVPNAASDGAPRAADPAEARWRPSDDEMLQNASEPEAQLDLFAAPAQAVENAPVAEGTLRAPRRWERLLVEASVIGGLGRWKNRLDGLAASLEIKLETRDDLSEGAQERIEQEIEHLQSLRDFALPLLRDLEACRGPATWGVWIDRLSSLATRSVRDPDRILGVLGELAPMDGVGPVSIDEVCRVLGPHLLTLTISSTGGRYGCVYVGPIEAARGRAFKVVYLPGFAERVFPGKIVQDPILSDRVRGALSDRLVTNHDRVSDERLALRLGVGAAREQLTVSFPRVDLEHARRRVSSFYALEVFRAATGTLPTVTELDEWAQSGRVTRPGWPAPRDPDDAVDAAEYDLAVLESLLDLPEDEAKGAGQFLLSENAHLARSLRWRWMRHANGWTGADGLMIRKRLDRAAIEAHRLSARPYSPTALQHFATCPYRFFLHGVQRLSPREEAEAIEQMDPLQRGSLVHDVHYATLSALRDENLLPVTPANLALAYGVLKEAVLRVETEYRERLAPAIARVWRDGVDSIHADLREWLLRMSQDESGYVPWRFELSFGLSERDLADPDSSRDPVELIEGFRLRGCIDLVERREDGSLRVTDHKTGSVRVPEGAIVAGGESLQALLYGLSLTRLLPDTPRVEARLYYATSTGGFTERGFGLDAGAREIARRVAETIDSAVGRGQLPSAPKQEGCRFCDFKAICGHGEEGRTSNKPDIPSLTWLRSLT